MKDQKPFQEIPNDEDINTEKYSCLISRINDCLTSRTCAFIIALIIIISAYLIILFSFLLTEDSYSENLSISAKLPLGGSHKRTCDDTEYGCCKIFTDCKVVDDHVNYEHININVHRIKSHDNFMSNCPSLETLINKYNRHYGNISTDCGKFGCCPGVNLDCDNAIRKSIRNGNNQNTIDTFLNHKKYKPILINKIDSKGSNCYQNNLYDIIYSYEHYYPEKNNGTDLIIYIIGIILFILWLTN